MAEFSLCFPQGSREEKIMTGILPGTSPPPPPKSTEPWPYWVLPGSLEFKVLLQLGAPWQSERAWGSPGSSFTPSLLPCVRMWSKDEAAPLCKFL